MVIRQDFHPQTPLPPRLFLEQVMDPLAKFYCFLWDKKTEENRFEIAWKDLGPYYNKNAFRSNLRKLGNLGLVSYVETRRDITIELVGWDEVVAGG